MRTTILFALIAFLLVLAACEDTELPKNEQPDGATTGSEPVAKAITPEECKAANGNWNECGSPCAGIDAEVCIQVCSAQCECGGIAGFGCPEGYKCRLTGKIADEMGV
ncbi:hypothetical protein HYU10_01055, partial [Candidatus Woesearchaeota archaeon]|nr:hypothetical protein [Candidatus Woesearchaeota archaeon]MBI2130335.1 hypothetical protein [Candidatus Woesearchaeota archaeon]